MDKFRFFTEIKKNCKHILKNHLSFKLVPIQNMYILYTNTEYLVRKSLKLKNII